MNASTLESLLQDLVNHSNHSEELKDKLRNKLCNYEKKEAELKSLKIRFNNVARELNGFNANGFNAYEDDDEHGYIIIDEDDVEDEPHLIDRGPRPPTQYNTFIKNTMMRLKLENPTMKNIGLMSAAARKWNDAKIKMKEDKINLLKEIADYKIKKLLIIK